MALDRLRSDVLAKVPAVVLIAFGINDAYVQQARQIVYIMLM